MDDLEGLTRANQCDKATCVLGRLTRTLHTDPAPAVQQMRFIGRRLLAVALWIELRREMVYDLVENCLDQLGARTLLPHDDVGPEYPTLSGPDPDSAPASDTRGSSLLGSLDRPLQALKAAGALSRARLWVQLISGTEPTPDAARPRAGGPDLLNARFSQTLRRPAFRWLSGY